MILDQKAAFQQRCRAFRILNKTPEKSKVPREVKTQALPTHRSARFKSLLLLSQPPDHRTYSAEITLRYVSNLPLPRKYTCGEISRRRKSALYADPQSRNNYYNISIRQLQGRYKILPVEFFAFFRPSLVHFLQTSKICV